MSALRRTVTTTLVGLSATAAIAGCSSSGTDSPDARQTTASSSPTTNLPEASQPASSVPSGDSSPSSSASRSAPYADGEYTVDGEYGTRDSSIGVQLTLKDGEITAVEVAPHATNDTSRELQTRFAEAVPQLVIGRDIDDVSLDRVAGNSNTPQGFNDALEEIKDLAGR
ncbi:hypothetical protein [Streptomyces niveus]|uniref:hypothetical protein n=1 Tax=Streptomyces niveus TaxID=193462 RepID=UPI0003C61E24|nr:hypothetical protein [Streptomyces niveus]EST23028.1 hypothetical protein M877_28325 [Streptomyces niveus NCIMB 11891]